MRKYIQQVLASTTSIYILIEKNGEVNFISSGAEKILGYKLNEIKESNWYDLTRKTNESREAIRNRIDEYFNSPKTKTLNYTDKLIDNYGREKWILWNANKTADGKILATGQDITLQKENENKLQSKNSSLNILNKELSDSIKYAWRLQRAILKNPDELKQMFSDSFIFYKPKNVVSGDFYLFLTIDNYKFVAVIDCTGHGVPGAMLSIIANTLLRDIIKSRNIIDPAEILRTLDSEFVNYLNENDALNEISDGLDIALCRIDRNTNELIFSGAFRPLLILRENDVIEIKANRYPIGLYSGVQKTFLNQQFSLKTKDRLILFSDGYLDQFGGEFNKKLNRRRFVQLLQEGSELNGCEFESYLEYAFENWKQNNEQTDDVTVLGVEI